jgi:hypothetical protein
MARSAVAAFLCQARVKLALCPTIPGVGTASGGHRRYAFGEEGAVRITRWAEDETPDAGCMSPHLCQNPQRWASHGTGNIVQVGDIGFIPNEF